MRARDVAKALTFCFKNKKPLLLKGAPGIGKTSIPTQVCKEMDIDLIISHPAVKEPTDYTGLPFPSADKKSAIFLPFGDLKKILEVKRPTVFFFDDLGQAPTSVQAGVMQLLGARQVNGHKISDHVTFLAATNRRKDKAGVQGILEPVKSRFYSIIEVETHIDDWISWAIKNNMPSILIAYLKYHEDYLIDFHPTSDIVNSPSPRTWEAVGDMLNNGISERFSKGGSIEQGSAYISEMIGGAVSMAQANEFIAFTDIIDKLNSYSKILNDPTGIKIPDSPSILWAECSMLIRKTTKKDFSKIFKYIKRLDMEFQLFVMQSLITARPEIALSRSFITWSTKMGNLLGS